MSGFINNGVPELAFLTDDDLFNADTQNTAGLNPESGSVSALRLATALLFLQNKSDITPVSGTVYYRKFTISQQVQLTGLEYLIGATGGTDKIVGYVFDANGAAFAHTDTAGDTVGTANAWQQLPFQVSGADAPVTFPAGTYYLALQLNGTTARVAAYNAPGLTLVTGSKTGVFGTQGTITPATTYTAATGPVMQPYQ